MRILSLNIIVYIVAALLSYQSHASSCRNGSFSAGFLPFSNSKGSVGIWYPASQSESSYKYRGDFSGSVALNSLPASCKKFPLIVFSHGAAGCGTEIAYLTEHLARAGFVILVVDHADAMCNVYGGGSMTPAESEEQFNQPDAWNERTEVDRRDDITRALNSLLASNEWKKVIDADNIGGIGQSVGAYIIAGMSGARDSWKDARIKSALLLSPFLSPYLKKKEIEKISIPLMYQAAVLNANSVSSDSSFYEAIKMGKMPKYIALFQGKGGMEWHHFLCAEQETVKKCGESVREVNLINNYAEAFFNATLRGQSNSLDELNGVGLVKWTKQ